MKRSKTELLERNKNMIKEKTTKMVHGELVEVTIYSYAPFHYKEHYGYTQSHLKDQINYYEDPRTVDKYHEEPTGYHSSFVHILKA